MINNQRGLRNYREQRSLSKIYIDVYDRPPSNAPEPVDDLEAARRHAAAQLPADDTTSTVVAIRTSEIIATNQIQPDKTY